MENLSELQNPLLDKNSKHMVNGYGGDFANNQCRENIINYFAGGVGGGEGGGKVNNRTAVGGGCCSANGKVKSQQLLDATSLHLAVEAFYRPNFILYKEDSGSIKAKEYKSECCETTFTEKKAKEGSGAVAADAPGPEDAQAKLMEDAEHIKIQTVSYEVEEEEYVEYEVRPSSNTFLRAFPLNNQKIKVQMSPHQQLPIRPEPPWRPCTPAEINAWAWLILHPPQVPM